MGSKYSINGAPICWPCLYYQGKDIVFRFIIEYSSLKGFWPLLGNIIIIIGLFLYEDFWKIMIFWLVLKLEISYRVINIIIPSVGPGILFFNIFQIGFFFFFFLDFWIFEFLGGSYRLSISISKNVLVR